MKHILHKAIKITDVPDPMATPVPRDIEVDGPVTALNQGVLLEESHKHKGRVDPGFMIAVFEHYGHPCDSSMKFFADLQNNWYAAERVSEKLPDLICQVCYGEQALGVACVPGIPMSVAYGRKCLEQDAHPLEIIRGNVALCGGLEHMHEHYGETRVFHKEHGYITIADALARNPLKPEELTDDGRQQDVSG